MSVRIFAPGLFLLALAVMLFTFRDGLASMVSWWDEPEYSHGYLIPFISLYLLAVRLELLDSVKPSASWAGVVVVEIGLQVGAGAPVLSELHSALPPTGVRLDSLGRQIELLAVEGGHGAGSDITTGYRAQLRVSAVR